MRDLQTAIIGLGFVGRAHLEALRRLGVYVRGVLESSIELGEAAARNGRKNRLWIEIDGSQGALSWDSEDPNRLWVGSRSGPNQVMIKDPSLLDASICSYAGYPGGHPEGYPDTFVQLFKSVYAYIARGYYQEPRTFPTFEAGYEEVLLGEVILESALNQRWCQAL